MEIVNGYVCNNCSDVELAKKGVDPARPKEQPAVEQQTPTERGPAVTFGGELAQTQGVENVRPAPYAPGAGLNLSA